MNIKNTVGNAKMNSGNLDKRNVATKRDDPNYAQVSGYVQKDKALKFKINCTALQITQSEALDEAISLWLEKNNSSKGVA
jgi:hypothetical protein